MPKFQVVSDYTPSGDQPEAIASLAQGVELGLDEQTLLGVTGSGKTFTMAKVIERVQRPTLVLAHNKTLAAQLCAEFKEFFPNNAVEYFVSYYDYYQPEAYIPHTDTFIEKDSAINDEIERLRHSATSALFERRDVIVVASVSCIYGLGDPIDYSDMVISLRTGQERPMTELLNKLTEIRYVSATTFQPEAMPGPGWRWDWTSTGRYRLGKTFTWPRSSSRSSGPPWSWPTTRLWPPSCAPEFKEFFPNNAVEYFVSYYDITSRRPISPTRTRSSRATRPSTTRSTACVLSATSALLERRDVIVVSSVSCIYGLGDPIADFANMMISPGGERRDRAAEQTHRDPL